MTDTLKTRLAEIEDRAAELIYEAMRFEREKETPYWENGNSVAEDTARETMREVGIPFLCEQLRTALDRVVNDQAMAQARIAELEAENRVLRMHYTGEIAAHPFDDSALEGKDND